MNAILDPNDPDYCATCGGECVAGCRTVQRVRLTLPKGYIDLPEALLDKVRREVARHGFLTLTGMQGSLTACQLLAFMVLKEAGVSADEIVQALDDL